MEKRQLNQTILLVGVLLWMPAASFAQDNSRTLHSCIDQALEKNIQIQKSGLSIASSEIQLEMAKNNRFPTVDGSMRQNLGWSNQTDAVTGTSSFEGSSSTSASVGAGVVLFNGFRLNLSIDQARLDWEAGKLDLETLKETISLSVMDAYLQILYAQEQVKNANRQLEATGSELRLAQERLALKAISKADYLQVRSQLASEQLTLANAENLLAINNVILLQLMEEPVGPDFTIVQPDLTGLVNRNLNPDPDSVYRIAYSLKPQIRSAENRLENAGVGIDLARADYFPRLSMDAGLSTSYSSLMSQSNLANQLGDNINPTIGLSLSVPIWSNRKITNQVRLASLSRDNAKLDLSNTANQLRKSVEQACTVVTSAQKEFNASAQQYGSAGEAFAVAAEKFRQGMINSVDYLYLKTSLISAESKLLQSRYNLIFSYKLLDFYLGKPLTF